MIVQTRKTSTERWILFAQSSILIINIWIILIATILLVACGSPEPEPIIPTVSGFGADISCLFAEKEPNEAVVIRSLSDLEAYQDCMNSTADFDFTAHTLVGIRLQAGGCEFPEFNIADIRTDELNQIITISVEVKQKGKCAILHQTMDWITTYPLPDSYTIVVEFD